MKITNIVMAMKNRIFAIPAVAAERPEKPKSPAINEITKKISAHFNIVFSPHGGLPSGTPGLYPADATAPERLGFLVRRPFDAHSARIECTIMRGRGHRARPDELRAAPNRQRVMRLDQLAQPLGQHMGVNLSRRDVGMTQQ